MFDKFLNFFLENARLNYLLFVLIFSLGVYAYTQTPKEVFPSFELDRISVSGSYSGASIDILDKMAVSQIEKDLKSIDAIEDMTTIIVPGRFTIALDIASGRDRYNVANRVQDVVSANLQNLPADMDEPTVQVLELSRNLLEVALLSKSADSAKMLDHAKDIESGLMDIDGVKEVTIYGDSELFYDLVFDDKKVQAYGLNVANLVHAIAEHSYTFPLGKIEDSTHNHYFLSTKNGPQTAAEFEKLLLAVDGHYIQLDEVATVQKRYKDAATLFSVDGQNAINLVLMQDPSADAITIANGVKEYIQNLEKTAVGDISYIVKNDESQRIKERLNVVISNILLGVILITLIIAYFVNRRLAFIIMIGIPTSFVIGALYFWLSGHSINMISLVGVLIALGIIVDDAIVVSENIQQHLEQGYTPKEAALMGAKEMFKPVTLATVTTLFSFIPILMITGTMGEVIKLIPIAFSALVIASLVESFVFLPIHASHVLKSDSKVQSWEKVTDLYSKLIQQLIIYRKTFLIIFIVGVPVLTIYFIKIANFQMFATFDAATINISLKKDINSDVAQTYKTVQSIEKDLLGLQDKLHFKHVSSVAGFRRDSAGNSENYPYVGYITIELQKLKPQTFVDRYITPYLSFYYDKEDRVREKSSTQIARQLREFLEKKDYASEYNLQDIAVVERRMGPIKTDIEIGLSSPDSQEIRSHIDRLSQKLSMIDGVNSISSNMTDGVQELKLHINSYGQSLGITERSLGNFLSNFYLSQKVASAYSAQDLLQIHVQSVHKDSLPHLKRLKIPTPNNRYVALKDVVDFKSKKTFEKMTKDWGEVQFYLFANVDTSIITATQVLQKIDPYLQEIAQDGTSVRLGGEQESKEDLRRDMLGATALALALIMVAMLYMFNSFKQSLIVMSTIPFSLLGMLIGHQIMGINLTMPSIIGTLGLAGVVVNDGIIMMNYLRRAKSLDQLHIYAKKRFRPIILTTVTTLVGLSSLIFFPTGEATVFQPMAIALGFGLAWATVLNLLYLPSLYALTHRLK